LSDLTGKRKCGKYFSEIPFLNIYRERVKKTAPAGDGPTSFFNRKSGYFRKRDLVLGGTSHPDLPPRGDQIARTGF